MILNVFRQKIGMGWSPKGWGKLHHFEALHISEMFEQYREKGRRQGYGLDIAVLTNELGNHLGPNKPAKVRQPKDSQKISRVKFLG